MIPGGRDENTVILERIAAAVEKLAEDPVVEMEVGPPVCPHCGEFNPTVKTEDAGGIGRIMEVYIGMVCQECGHEFAGVPVQWTMATDSQQLREVLEARAAYVDNGRRR